MCIPSLKYKWPNLIILCFTLRYCPFLLCQKNVFGNIKWIVIYYSPVIFVQLYVFYYSYNSYSSKRMLRVDWPGPPGLTKKLVGVPIANYSYSTVKNRYNTAFKTNILFSINLKLNDLVYIITWNILYLWYIITYIR